MSKLEEQAVDIAKKQILIKLAEDEPYLFGEDGVYHKVKQLQNGEIQFTLRIKDSFVTDLVMTEVKRFVFKRNGK